jgi:hypothetical protein
MQPASTITMREPYLSSARALRELFDYDPETGALTWRQRGEHWFESQRAHSVWNTKYAGKEAFGIIARGYRCGKLLNHSVKAHRVIWKWMTGVDAEIIDHINGQRSDNRWANLRSTNVIGNARNQARPDCNRSGRIGVARRSGNTWRAYIGTGQGQRMLGTFSTFEQAAAARARAEHDLEYHPNHGRQKEHA